jgi:hypothetical protein
MALTYLSEAVNQIVEGEFKSQAQQKEPGSDTVLNSKPIVVEIRRARVKS